MSRGSEVRVDAFAYTTHVLEVDLTERLAALPHPTDGHTEVIVVLRTPNGRGKRIRIPEHMLVSTEDPWA